MKRKKHGYTIIEMLIVVTMIVIISGLLFPVLKKVRDSGKKIKCLSNLRQLGTAINLYIQDDAQGRYPGWSGDCADVKALPNLLWRYLGQENNNTLVSGEMLHFRCPSNVLTSNMSERIDAYNNQVDYSMNCNLMGQSAVSKIGNDTIAAVLYDQPVYPDNSSDQVHFSGSNILFADGHADWIPRTKVNSSWSGVPQYGGTRYDDWGLI